METASPYRPVLERALAHALTYLGSLEDKPVAAPATLAELRARLARPLFDDGIDAAQVVDELAADVAGGVQGSASGRFFGWVIGGSLPAALAADWLTSTWDQNVARRARPFSAARPGAVNAACVSPSVTGRRPMLMSTALLLRSDRR
jgi:hypothetical protein